MKTVIHVDEPTPPVENRNFLVNTDGGSILNVYLADDDGNEIDYCPGLFHINKRGRLVRNECVNSAVAKKYGIQLDIRGRIQLED